jgi:hypothetical protein
MRLLPRKGNAGHGAAGGNFFLRDFFLEKSANGSTIRNANALPAATNTAAAAAGIAHKLLKSIHFDCGDKLLGRIDSAQPHAHVVTHLQHHPPQLHGQCDVIMAHTLRPDSARMSGTTMPAKTGKRKGIGLGSNQNFV